MTEKVHENYRTSQDIIDGPQRRESGEVESKLQLLNDSVRRIEAALPRQRIYTTTEEKARAYWQRNLTIIGWLLAIWALVSFGFGILMATAPMGFVGVLPFSFWWAQQGSILVFLAIILVYAVLMDRLDKEFDLDEQ